MDKLDKAMGWAIVVFIGAVSVALSALGAMLWREVLR